MKRTHEKINRKEIAKRLKPAKPTKKTRSKRRKYLLYKIADHTGVILLGLLLLFIWQIYREPIALPFLKPYIIRALNHDSNEYEVTLDNVNLELIRSIQPIKIIANNVTYKKNDGNFTINAPKVSVSFSIRAILRGIIAPSNVDVMNPKVYIFTDYGVTDDKKEEITKKKITYFFESFENFLERFNSTDDSQAESFINSIRIRNAEVELHEVDLGRKWAFSDLNYSFFRAFSTIDTSLNALINQNEKVASLGVDAQYRISENKAALQFYFSEVVPSDIVSNFLDNDTGNKLYQVNLPISGKIQMLVNLNEVFKNREDIVKSLDTAIENVLFQFEGGAGNIMFSDNEEYKYDVASFVLEGGLDSGLNNMRIENAKFDLGTKTASLSLYVSGMKKYLLERELKDLEVSLRADVPVLDLDELSRYWPRYVASQAWEWCKGSIRGGKVENATFIFDFAYDEKSKSLNFANLTGQAHVADSNLNYLDGMPDINNLYATVYFYPDSLKIEAEKGVSKGVIVTGGHVRLYDLDKEDNRADINLQLTSEISDALRLIDHPPLGYTTEMGLDPNKIKGSAETDLSLNFELKENLKPKEVKVEVISKIKDMKIPNVIEKRTLSAQELNLKVTNDVMIIEGASVLDGINVDIHWREDFLAKNYKSKFNLSFRIDNAIKAKLGIDAPIINPPYIDGFADVVAEVTVFENDKMEININADLHNAEIDYSFLGFEKAENSPARALVKLNFVNNTLVSVPSFSLSKASFDIHGKVDLDNDGKLKLIDVYDIKGPRNSANAKIEFLNNPEKVNINITGDSYDLTEFFDRRENKNKKPIQTDNGKKDDDDNDLEKINDMDVHINVNRLWTNRRVSVRNFTGNAILRHGIGIHEMHLFGNYGDQKDITFKLDYVPRPNDEYMLSIDSNNAGSTLKVLRAYDHMNGGTLQIEAIRNSGKEFIGHAKLRDFHIKNTPVLAKLFSVASLTGMLDLLRGDGVGFSHFDAPIEYRDKTLHIRNAKAFGNVIGITANGAYNRRDESLSARGVIIPAYSLNMFIGRIPVVGTLLSGRDGAIFAANYRITGSISDPQVEINPLSALSPGSVRDLFTTTFGDGIYE